MSSDINNKTTELKIDVESGVKNLQKLSRSIDEVNASLNNLGEENIKKMVKAIEKMGDVFEKNAETQIESITAIEGLLSAFGNSVYKQIDTLNALKDTFQSVGEQITAFKTNQDEMSADKVTQVADAFTSGLKGVSEQSGVMKGAMFDLTKIVDGNNKAMFESLGILSVMIGAVSNSAMAAADLSANWDNLSGGERAVGVLKALAGAAIAAACAYALLKAAKFGPWAMVAGAAIAGIAICSLVEVSARSSRDIQNYANGGGFNTADLFYANEDGGVELVASSNSGGGAVMNMEQLKSAVYDGVYAAMQSAGGGRESNVVIDGSKVGKVVARGVYNEGKRVGYWR